MEKKQGNIVKSAATLGVGAMLAKLLGAIYRIPLTNLLGGLGLGLYQMVFPVYSVLLDFSGAGAPSALSKIISSYNGEDKERNAYNYLSGSLRLFFFFGLFCSLIMLIFAKPLAMAQGNSDAYLAYLFLSPAIFGVSLISCFRGYFQGKMNMVPTAVSQIIEQLVKLGFGLLFAYLFLPNIPKAVAGATFAITLSEFSALVYLFSVYLKSKKKLGVRFCFEKNNFGVRAKTVIKNTVPITLTGIMLPLSQVIDSFLILNLLGAYRQDATSLYGLLSGVAATVIGLPVSVCYGVAAVAIPTVSASKTETEKRSNASKTLLLTTLVALPCAIFTAIFAPFIIGLLFRGLNGEEKLIAINLLRLSSPNVLLLSLLQTGNAVLIGKGKLYFPVLSLSVGVAVKTVLNLILLDMPRVNIYGGALAIIACYFTVCLLNLFIIFSEKVKNEDSRSCRREYAS